MKQKAAEFDVPNTFIRWAKGFGGALRWFVKGSGKIEFIDETLRVVANETTVEHTVDVQLNDHGRERNFIWQPPLTLTIQARFSHATDHFQGTAGFGFWNKPVKMSRGLIYGMPRAAWFFFASQPSDIKLAEKVDGYGWKAATMDAGRWPFLALLPFAPVMIPIFNIGWLRRKLWPIGQRAMGVQEQPLAIDWQAWHTYEIKWGEKETRFAVDGVEVLRAPSPRGPLGFVVWIDNKWAILRVDGRIGKGKLAFTEEQWLEIREMTMEKGCS
ncbi:MAG: hypothetical protein ACPG8W_02270 [Candidatus Promineifilaceae bacterium]